MSSLQPTNVTVPAAVAASLRSHLGSSAVSADVHVARPEGQPGTVGRDHGAGASWSYPARQSPDGTVWFWRDTTEGMGRWIQAPPRLAASFEAGEEWQARCGHQHGVPWQTCDTEADCDRLAREDERTWGR